MSAKERSLPTHRISRFSKFASLATRVAGNVIAEGTKQIAKGNKPKAKDLLLTPQNIARLTDQLAHLRGAAMKLGQMLSMDAGDVLEPELADILSRLRSNADPMPAKQLNGVMESSLGTSWKAEFLSFNFKPIASASIGQVHQAYSDQTAAPEAEQEASFRAVRDEIASDHPTGPTASLGALGHHGRPRAVGNAAARMEGSFGDAALRRQLPG